jgi:hypothetical protein
MKPCCEDPTNRREGYGPRGDVGMEGVNEREDTTVTHCVICSARHVEVEAEVGQIGVAGAKLG